MLNFVEVTFEAKNMYENNKVDLAYFFGGDLGVLMWVNGRLGNCRVAVGLKEIVLNNREFSRYHRFMSSYHRFGRVYHRFG